ncbi:MAG: transposase [Phycisphaerales bacterium]|nr:transposase [Phycisphaerales bacterium]
MQPPRKRVEHFDLPGHARELTFSCYRRRALLEEPHAYAVLGQAVTKACALHGFDILAFVFMPEHVHLLVFPNADPGVSPLLKSIKQGASRVMKRHFEVGSPELVLALTITERPGKQTFRFWQEGPGYDRNITNRNALATAIHYIHNNPVARGLCKRPAEWAWSSIHQYDHPGLPAADGVPTITRRFV